MTDLAEKKPFIIAIDGPAGSGKTTTAKALAAELNYVYVDTGAMYRAVALFVLRRQLRIDDAHAVCGVLSQIEITLEIHESEQRTLLNGEDVEEQIRTQEMSKAASDVSAHPCVREAMVELQRSVGGSAGGAVLEGRDIGTVVFPDAPCKIFLVADVDARAERRMLQLREKGLAADSEIIRREIEQRDLNDAAREHSPLRKAEDAIEVETTNTTIEEQVMMILSLVRNRLENWKGQGE